MIIIGSGNVVSGSSFGGVGVIQVSSGISQINGKYYGANGEIESFDLFVGDVSVKRDDRSIRMTVDGGSITNINRAPKTICAKVIRNLTGGNGHIDINGDVYGSVKGGNGNVHVKKKAARRTLKITESVADENDEEPKTRVVLGVEVEGECVIRVNDVEVPLLGDDAIRLQVTYKNGEVVDEPSDTAFGAAFTFTELVAANACIEYVKGGNGDINVVADCRRVVGSNGEVRVHGTVYGSVNAGNGSVYINGKCTDSKKKKKKSVGGIHIGRSVMFHNVF